jgi:hypothetical protein
LPTGPAACYKDRSRHAGSNPTSQAISRRQFLQHAAAVAAAGLAAQLPLRTAYAVPTQIPRASAAGLARTAHLAWVWQFSTDGSAGAIRDILAQNRLGIILKSHDATTWMARYDRSPDAVNGASQLARLASFFEAGGVPFHAWTVLHGRDVEEEARMAAAVLDAGARSLTVDVEPGAGFWAGSREDAHVLMQRLRDLQPDAFISTAFDPRPWINAQIPIREFAAASDELAPMIYWEEFGTRANLVNFARAGIPVSAVEPRLLISLAAEVARPFGLPIQPIGQGASMEGWTDFLGHALGNARVVSVWRYGVAPPQVWGLLKERPPQPRAYVVEPGDSLAALAQAWRTTIDAIATMNGIPDPDLIRVGQTLLIPR